MIKAKDGLNKSPETQTGILMGKAWSQDFTCTLYSHMHIKH